MQSNSLNFTLLEKKNIQTLIVSSIQKEEKQNFWLDNQYQTTNNEDL